MSTDVTAGLIGILVALVIYIIFFLWQKRIAEDILHEKGQERKIGALLFFMPLICWVYVCALPNKSNNN